MVKKRFLLMMLLAVLCAASGTAQKFRMNRQMMRLEGNFVQKTPVSNQTCIYMDDITITAGETKTVTAYLRSVEPMWMLQVYFNLPTGMTASGAALTSSFNSLVGSNSGFSLSSSTVSGQYRVVLANMAKTTAIPTVDGQSVFTFNVTAAPNMTAGEYVLSTSDFKFVSATSDEGDGYIGANTSCHVTVNEPQATGIALNQQSITLQQGSTQTLTATVTPSYASQTVSWNSSNTSVATVNASGKVTAVGVGNCIVTATTTDGTQLSASCQVNVTPVMVTGITLNSTSATIYPGDDLQLTATVSPSNATNKAVTWRSSNTSVATVDATGKVSAIAVGSATITATATDGSGKSASCSITVAPILATSVTLNRTSASVNPGETVQLVATVLPENATNKTVTWSSSNTTVATVDSNGKVTGKTTGSCTITCTTADGSGKTATCAITVNAILATSVTLNQTSASLYPGETVQLTATVLPSNATNKAVTWRSSNTAVATVDSNGKVTAKATGTATITVTTADGSGKTATCAITVNPVLATSVSLNQTSATLYPEGTVQLTATVLPTNASNKTVTWHSSNTGVATVDSNGKVTGKAPGSCTITVTTTDGSNKSATCAITVNPILATSVSLNMTGATLMPEETLQLTATVLPGNASNKAVTWTSSNTSVATVSQNGKVTAHAPGNCNIIVTTADGSNKSASCAITVNPIIATGLALNLSETNMRQGDRVKLVATITPSNASNKDVVWSTTNNAIATVDADGTVTAMKPGDATIIARTTDGSNLTAECNVHVTQSLATSLTLEYDEMEVFVGDVVQMRATVLPADASQVLNWTSSKRTVATIDSNGQLVAVGEGTTVIVVSTTDGSNLNATCIVTVKPVKATGISLSESRLNMELNETATLTAVLEPENVTVKTLTWQSSDTNVATVDQNGMVTALALGNAVITATTTDGTNLSATCQVSVGAITVKSVTLDQHEAQVILGNNLQLTATVQPDNAANKTLQWQSSDNTVATVDQNGLVNTVGLGQVFITAATTDGSNLKDSCAVTVLPVLVTSIVLDKSEMEVYVEMTDTIRATVMPDEATIKNVVWTSSNEAVVTVDANGIVTAVSVGNAIITATATDGSGVTATCRVTVPAANGNYLSAESFTIVRGNEIIVPIAMTNSSKIAAMQCELRLTGGIEVADDGYGDPDIYLSDRATDHELTCTQRQDFMQILAASITSAPFKSNMGTLYYIHLKADKNLEEGTYMMALRNITLSTVDGQRIKPNDVEVTIGIQPYMLGDANGDAHVDVADFLTTANYILYKEPFPFYFRAADVDANGAVDANDLTGITNIGLGKASGTVNMPAAERANRAPQAAVQSTDKLYIADFDLQAGQTKTVSMALDNTQTYAGMQCDLSLPDGLTLVKVEKATRCRNHTLTTNVLDNGSTRLWLSSMSSRTISGNSGALLTVTVKATSDFSGTHQLWLRNIVGAHETSDASGERIELVDNMTSINPSALVGDVTGDGTVDVADVNAIINIMLGKAQANDYPGNADASGDGSVDVADVNIIVNIMLGK